MVFSVLIIYIHHHVNNFQVPIELAKLANPRSILYRCHISYCILATMSAGSSGGRGRASAVGHPAKEIGWPKFSSVAWLVFADLKTKDDLIDFIAIDSATQPQWAAFEQLVIGDSGFRQQVARRKEKFRSQGESGKAERLNEAMVNMVQLSISGKAEGDFASDAGSKDVDYDSLLFNLITKGGASMRQRNLFRDKLLQSDILYRQVSNMHRICASLPSAESKTKAKNLERALKRCDTMRAEMQEDRAMRSDSSAEESVSGGSVTGGSDQVLGCRSGGGSSQPLRRPPLMPDKSFGDRGVDLIELVACKTASFQQGQLFVRTFKNDKAYQHEVLNRDRKYLSSKTPEGYEKAANLRIAMGKHGDAALLSLCPWNHHLVEGFRLADERLGSNRPKVAGLPEFLAEEAMLYQADRLVEAQELESKKRRPRGTVRGRESPAEGEGPAASRIPARGQSSGSEGGQAREQTPTDTDLDRKPKPAGELPPPHSGRTPASAIPLPHPGRTSASARSAGQEGGSQTTAASHTPREAFGSFSNSAALVLVARAIAVSRADAFQATAAAGFANQANEPSHASTLGSQSECRSTTPIQPAVAEPERPIRADASSTCRPSAKSHGGGRSGKSSRSKITGSKMISQSTTSSDQPRRDSQSGGRLNKPSQPATSESTSTRQPDTSSQYTRSYLVSENAMEQLHKKIKEARAAKSARSGMEPPQYRGQSRQQNR